MGHGVIGRGERWIDATHHFESTEALRPSQAELWCFGQFVTSDGTVARLVADPQSR